MKSNSFPSDPQPDRAWRTRQDPFNEDWADIQSRLEAAPELEARALFEDLQARKPGQYEDKQLRTFQRRVKAWRAQHGPEKEMFFAQIHKPGEALQTDFTHINELGVTVLGRPVPLRLCQVVLPYSNWQWVTVCQSESMLAMRKGVQAALAQLGCVPTYHQTDNSTSATHDLAGGKRGFNEQYAALMRQMGMEPRTIAVGKSVQNGDVESANGSLKRRLKQILLLRGSRDFESLEALEVWAQGVCRAANQRRQSKVCEELAVMKPRQAKTFPEYDEVEVTVSQESTIRIKRNVYSVPTRLIGEHVRVRVYELHLEIWHSSQRILWTERILGEHKHRIEYRHVIGSLLRKPGAFARYRHREELFPGLVWRQAFDLLVESLGGRQGEVAYLRLLYRAATTMEAEVESALELLLEAKELPTPEKVQELIAEKVTLLIPELAVPEVNLLEYDILMRPSGSEAV